MKRSLRGLYWVAIACMLVMAVVAVALLLDFRVKDRSESCAIFWRPFRRGRWKAGTTCKAMPTI